LSAAAPTKISRNPLEFLRIAGATQPPQDLVTFGQS